MTVQVTTPFAVAFGRTMHPDAARLNRALRQLSLQREADRAAWQNPRATMRAAPGLFESRFDLFKWPDAAVRELREFCWQALYEMVQELNGYEATDLARLQGHADAWLHVMRSGSHFGLHNHPMASWSGVYCVANGKEDGAEMSGGLLSFADPLGGAGMFRDPGNAGLRMPFSSAMREYALEPGELVLFPSAMAHLVTPYFGEQPRITIAFNAWFTYAPPTR